MRHFRSACLTLSALLISVLIAAPAVAEDHRVYFSFGGEKRLPECAASSAQGAARNSIARARQDYYGGLKIVEIDSVQEVAFQVNGVSPVARRYCRGQANLSDGTYQTVHYLIEEHGGFLGLGWNVEACLAPLDKWHVYGASCSTARPRPR